MISVDDQLAESLRMFKHFGSSSDKQRLTDLDIKEMAKDNLRDPKFWDALREYLKECMY